MRRYCTLILSFLTCALLELQGAPQEQLRVFITDAASTPPLVLADAQRRATGLLAAAGVRSSWKVCPPSSMLPGRRPCADAGSLAVSVRILRSADAKVWPVERQSCGLALAGDSDEHGFLAIVDAGCIERVAGVFHESWSTVLGHVMAHEIGHLLLGRESHGSSGLMSARWTADEQASLVRGELRFSSDDAARLRNAMTDRAAWKPGVSQARVAR
jgi:hypothetical protein